ncbi:MAG TPA: alpha-1,4-glucan--maltose-1-phosphate maltosyltransferase [Gemmatimonadaceae bacterium]|nr:alpha-1,4-glucan--maltose-1-phosphate maltosyltransferase [Gemmatimonadaceae bacterium]
MPPTPTAPGLSATGTALAPSLRVATTSERPARASRARREPASRDASRELYHLTIECVTPELEAGRYPVKRLVGDVCEVGADIIKDGHDMLAARVRYRGPDGEWQNTPLTYDYNEDRWTGRFTLDRIGRWRFTVEGWTDRFGTWRAGLEKKIAAKQDVELELVEGALLVEATAKHAPRGDARTALTAAAATLRDKSAPKEIRYELALSPALLGFVAANYAPDDLTSYRREVEIVVDRELAGFASWYEFFPRSTSRTRGRHGTFADATTFLPRVAELGFSVVYLPPIHPIGRTFRKGRNNTLTPEPNDVGSPWAIGNENGGHTAIEPALGTIEDFDRFVAKANELKLEVALDYALQCSPDHPWVKEHPDWFHIRPDGSIQYAENPPKKYQDIYPIDFWCADRENLWAACRDVLLYWIEHGVRTFRVDNPHTKPLAFWEWVIGEVKQRHPDIIFFAEAFTRPKRMKALAKLGFTQSYTYYTWKNTSYELRELMEDLTGPAAEYVRGNLFANTPDILHEYLVEGGRPAFRIRLFLAGTLSPLYGIYSGYELAENVPVRAGSEEYLDSEKYQIRQRNFDAPGNINDDIRRLNRIRCEQWALQQYRNLTFHRSENEHILFYRKAGQAPAAGAEQRPGTAPAGQPCVSGGLDAADLLIAVNLDPKRAHDTMVHVPLAELGIPEQQPYVVEDLLSGARYTWRGARNYVRLDPAIEPAHILRVHR